MSKHLKLFGAFIAVILIALTVFVIYKMNRTVIRQTKDYAVIYVEENDFIDYKAMKSPPDKLSQLLQINADTRESVASYMKKNNLKLKSGKHQFVRNNPTLDELIFGGFSFEKIGG